MRHKNLRFSIRNIAVFAMLTFASISLAWAGAKKEILYSFKGGNDGKLPTYSQLIVDKAGNLYGTTFDGGRYGLGTVFELKPNKDGTWTESIIHAFAGKLDGAFPFSGLISDDAGNLYGTTGYGGGLGSCLEQGVNYYCGTVYRLRREGSGQWSETVLRSFDDGTYGGYLYNISILDGSGNLYGVAEGGAAGYGVVFELIPQAKTPWKEKVLYSFHKADGNDPESPLIFDAKGNLYGTTIGGGPTNGGVAFELQPAKHGPWKETVLHEFTEASEGSAPYGLLALDTHGNLYGSTVYGGRYLCGGPGCGVVYELAQGSWKETVIHDFNGHNFKGITDDTQGVAFDASGNLYGTATGTALYPGGIFRLLYQRGTWVEQLIYKFPLDAFPGMVMYGSDGRLYGASVLGGKYNLGALFSITP